MNAESAGADVHHLAVNERPAVIKAESDHASRRLPFFTPDTRSRFMNGRDVRLGLGPVMELLRWISPHGMTVPRRCFGGDVFSGAGRLSRSDLSRSSKLAIAGNADGDAKPQQAVEGVGGVGAFDIPHSLWYIKRTHENAGPSPSPSSPRGERVGEGMAIRAY